MGEVATHEEALKLLTDAARKGSISAAIALERALRNVREEEQDEVGAALDRILAEKRPDRT